MNVPSMLLRVVRRSSRYDASTTAYGTGWPRESRTVPVELVLIAGRPHDPALDDTDAGLEVGADDEVERNEQHGGDDEPDGDEQQDTAGLPSVVTPRSAAGAASCRSRSLPCPRRGGTGLDNDVDRVGPEVRNVRAVDDLAHAGLGDEMPQALRREHHRVDDDLVLEVLARLALVGAIRVVADDARGIAAPQVRRQDKPPPCAAQTIRRGKRSSVPSKIMRLKNTVVSSGLPTMLPKPPRPSSAPSRAMFSALFGCMKTGTPSSSALAQNGSYFSLVGGSLSTWPPIEAPRQPKILDGVLELLGREIGKLQRDRAQADEARRVLFAPGGNAFVVRGDDGARIVAVRRVPPIGVDAERLNVDAALVHGREPLGPEHERRRRDARRVDARHAARYVGKHAMRVHVDDRTRAGRRP